MAERRAASGKAFTQTQRGRGRLAFVTDPTAARDTSDPGDATGRNFRYQHAYGVMLLIAAKRGLRPYVAIWCEQHEDFLAQCTDGVFDGYQIKTKRPELGAWTLRDGELTKSIRRFVDLVSEFSQRIGRFHFVSNTEFDDVTLASSDEKRRGRSPRLFLQHVRGCATRAAIAAPYDSAFDELLATCGCDADQLLAVLHRMDLIVGPSRNEFDAALSNEHIAQLEECRACTAEQLNIFRDELVAVVHRASSLQVTDPIRHLRPVLDGKDPDPVLAAKRIAVEDTVIYERSTPEKPGWHLPGVATPIGQTGLIDELTELMIGAALGPLLILGGPGIGKSTIARFAAGSPRVQAAFGNRRGFIRIDREGIGDSSSLRSALGRAVLARAGPTSWPDVLAELDRAPGLLILDNLETCWERDSDEVEQVLVDLAGLSRLRVCCTLRGAEVPRGPPWRAILSVPPLDPASSVALFRQTAGLPDAAGADVDDLVAAMEGLPLAIELTGQVASYTPLYEVLDAWRRSSAPAPGGLGLLEKSFAVSLDSTRMTDAGRRLFALLGRLPAGCDMLAVRALMDAESAVAVASLRRTRLAEDRGGRLVLLAPLREYANRQRLPRRCEQAIARHYLNLVESLVPAPGRAHGAAGVARLVCEGGNLDAAVRLALRPGARSLIDKQVLQRLSAFQLFSGAGSPVILLEVARVVESDDAGLAAQARLRAGEVMLHRAQHGPALAVLAAAGATFAELGDHVAEGSSVKCAGDVLLADGRFAEACAKYRDARRSYRRGRSVLGRANVFSRLADICIHLDRLSAAVRFTDRAQRFYSNLTEVLGLANCDVHRGEIWLRRGRSDEAETRFRAALASFEHQGDQDGRGRAELGLAAVAEAQSDRTAQEMHLTRALQAFEAVGNSNRVSELRRRSAPC